MGLLGFCRTRPQGRLAASMHSSSGKRMKGPEGYSEVASDQSRGGGPGREALTKEDYSPTWDLVELAWLSFGLAWTCHPLLFPFLLLGMGRSIFCLPHLCIWEACN